MRKTLLALSLGVLADVCPASLAAQPTPTAPAQEAAEPLAGVDAMVAEAERMAGLVSSPLGRALLAEVPRLPRIGPRPMLADRQARRCDAPATAETLSAEVKARLEPFDADENLYYVTKYGSPLGYIRAFDLLGAHMPTLAGARVLDYGYGTIGHLRLIAQCGGQAVGVDVDPFLVELYSHPEDQGAVASASGGQSPGKVTLVNGFWPGDSATLSAASGPFDVFMSKNTLKKGYINPDVEVDDRTRRMMLKLGVERADYLRAVHDALKPGGLFVIYNICPAQAAPGEPFLPMADGRCPWSPEELAAAGFEVIGHDVEDHDGAIAQGRALGWDKPPYNMKLEGDTFAWYTIARRRK